MLAPPSVLADLAWARPPALYDEPRPATPIHPAQSVPGPAPQVKLSIDALTSPYLVSPHWVPCPPPPPSRAQVKLSIDALTTPYLVSPQELSDVAASITQLCFDAVGFGRRRKEGACREHKRVLAIQRWAGGRAGGWVCR